MRKPISILLVEDEVINAMVMKKQLSDNGFSTIVHAATGEKAISSARQNLPDLILMDIRLAGEIDGIETASIIRSEFDVPVIFITSYNDPEIKRHAQAINPLAFLEKPLEMYELKSIIESHFALL